MHFFIYFSVPVFAVYVSGYQYIIRSPACQCFSFQTFAVDQCLYSFSDCFRAATFIYYTRLTQNVNTFFHLFSIFFLPLKIRKRQPFFPRNQSRLFIPSSMLFQHRQYILRNLLCSQMILLQYSIHIIPVKKFLFQSIIHHFHIACTIESCDFFTKAAI